MTDPDCEKCGGKGVGGGCGRDDCAEQGHMHTYSFCPACSRRATQRDEEE